MKLIPEDLMFGATAATFWSRGGNLSDKRVSMMAEQLISVYFVSKKERS